MLDSKNKEHDLLDLTAIQSETKYICEQCGIQLVLYPQAQIDNPLARGPCYICPNCHAISDASFGNLQHADDIKPIDIATPSFEIVPEQKGDKQLFFEQDYDPEPQEEEILRAQGATILSKKVDAKRD